MIVLQKMVVAVNLSRKPLHSSANSLWLCMIQIMCHHQPQHHHHRSHSTCISDCGTVDAKYELLTLDESETYKSFNINIFGENILLSTNMGMYYISNSSNTDEYVDAYNFYVVYADNTKLRLFYQKLLIPEMTAMPKYLEI